MVKQALQERRQHIRAKRVLGIQFRLVKSQRRILDKFWSLSTTQDMSLEGLSFYTDREYCPGDILNIHVIMSGILDVYKGFAEVVRVERKNSGVCFLAAVKYTDKSQSQKDSRTKNRSEKKHRSQIRV